MKVHSVIRKGEDHPVFCEDFMLTEDRGRYFYGAIFDGCSSGNESHFASSMFGKVFRHVIEDDNIYGETIEEKAKFLIKKFVYKLVESKAVMHLEVGDMLATFMLLMYDKVHGEAMVLTVGDGLIYCDGEMTELKNEKFKDEFPDDYMNRPDYIAYNLGVVGGEKHVFDFWYAESVNKMKFIDPKNIGIASDGILTFTNTEGDIDILRYFFEDERFIKVDNMMSRKVNILKKLHRSVHKDDFSIIRLTFKEEQDDSSSSQEGND